MARDDARRIRTLRDRADPKRTHVERIADRVANALGTPVFLAINLAWFGAWYLWHEHDVVITMLISLEAIVLSIFVLIAQKRSSRLDEMRSELDLEVNLIAEEELTKLPHVGVKRAKDIVALRQRLGRFRAVTDLLRVRGLGRKTLAKIAPKIVLDPPRDAPPAPA